MSCTIWINSLSPQASELFAQNLRFLLKDVNPWGKPLAFACIGSAKVTGDNLGPLIGTILSRCHCRNIYGTVSMPLNALTLPDQQSFFRQLEKDCCLIAIDASIGSAAQRGLITLTDQSLHPGSALCKNLPAIGHLHITGVFNILEDEQTRQLLPVLCRAISLGILDVCKNKR